MNPPGGSVPYRDSMIGISSRAVSEVRHRPSARGQSNNLEMREWPRNVREHENVLNQLAVFARLGSGEDVERDQTELRRLRFRSRWTFPARSS
jgi:DNA-binding NtrC family response regulator